MGMQLQVLPMHMKTLSQGFDGPHIKLLSSLKHPAQPPLH